MVGRAIKAGSRVSERLGRGDSGTENAYMIDRSESLRCGRCKDIFRYNQSVRAMLGQRGIKPENLPLALEKKVCDNRALL
jgi:hypothetical protein